MPQGGHRRWVREGHLCWEADQREHVNPDQDQASSLSDPELVDRVRRGDPRAFEVLVRRYVRKTHAVAASIVKDDDEADDVSQEAFVAALRRLDQLRQPERFQAWLLRITRNMALNHLKEGARSLAVPLESLEGFAGPDDPEETLRATRVQIAIHDAVAHLSGMPKRVFILHEIEGWDHQEISRELGISKGASRVHLHLARRTLRSRLTRPALEEG